jgi:hypothetical protein
VSFGILQRYHGCIGGSGAEADSPFFKPTAIREAGSIVPLVSVLR